MVEEFQGQMPWEVVAFESGEEVVPLGTAVVGVVALLPPEPAGLAALVSFFVVHMSTVEV
jgi:hypothetical protein